MTSPDVRKLASIVMLEQEQGRGEKKRGGDRRGGERRWEGRGKEGRGGGDDIGGGKWDGKGGRVDGQLQVAILLSSTQTPSPFVRPILLSRTLSAMAVCKSDAMVSSAPASAGQSPAPTSAAGAAEANGTLLYCFFPMRRFASD